MRLSPIVLAAALGLAACAPAPDLDIATRAAAQPDSAPLPAMKTFVQSVARAPAASNADIARDFLDLSFTLESGRTLDRFTRIDGPITLRLTGAPAPTLRADLARLLDRLRTEAGIAIARTDAADATITVEAVPRAAIRRALPQAACFVVPNVGSLAEYEGARGAARTSWSQLTERRRLAIFLPADASPQEARDCLHEELAQALGPLNDLYRLPDSVFNDDNFHTVLTGFDMLILRATYDPALRTGMTREEVAARLPAILARLNPAGERIPPRGLARTSRAWIDAVQTALGPGAGPAARRRAAQQALDIAEAEGWRDHRLGFAHFAMGRLMQGADPQSAKIHFTAAAEIFAASPQTALHGAYAAAQQAAHALAEGQGDVALDLTAPHLDVAARHENAALLASLMMLRAEALDQTGRPSEARAVRLDSLGWARYGFGPDWAVRAKLREVASLNALRPGGRSGS